jgi:aspartyl protease family protein
MMTNDFMLGGVYILMAIMLVLGSLMTRREPTAKLNGEDVKFLVDSGATMTTIDRDTARKAGVPVSSRRDEFVRTGNGIIRVSSGRADTLVIGGIERSDVGLQIAEHDDLNVLGMNYLSSLTRWGVEGRWLVLVS